MKKCNFLKIMFVFALVVASLSTYAQNSDGEMVKTEINTPAKPCFLKNLYVSGDLGSGILDGDNTGVKLGFNGHLGLGFQFSKWVGIKVNLGYGSLDGKFETVNKHPIYKLNYLETNINLTFNLMNIIFGFKPERKFEVIPHIGYGQIQYRLGSQFANFGYDDSGIFGRKVVAEIPFGVEVDYALTNRWMLFLDFTANHSDTDLIEGLVANNNNDWFHSISIGANYKFKFFECKKCLEKPENLIKANISPCSNYWYMAVDGGISLLFADNKAYSNSLESNINVGVGYNFGDYFRVYGRIGNGKISGEDKDELWSISDVNYFQASLNFSTDVIGLIAKTTDKRFELYPHIGIGQMFRTTTYIHYEDNNDLIIGDDFLLFPVGIELAYNITNRTDLYADATTYFSQSDLLDCIESGKANDAYSTFNIGLRYKFNKSCVDPEENITPEEVKQAIQNALEQQKAEEENNKPACVTPEELKQAIKDAIDEYEANRPKVDEKFGCLSNATIINNNFSDISFPKNGAQKLRTQTHIDAIKRASNQVNDGSAVNRIIIEGYASPEGNKNFNDRLALQRAEQAAKLIQNELGEIDTERIEITNKGADWEGFYLSLENSEIKDKENIIEQLKNSENPEITLQEILKSNPEVKQLLPQLRRASIVITTVK